MGHRWCSNNHNEISPAKLHFSCEISAQRLFLSHNYFTPLWSSHLLFQNTVLVYLSPINAHPRKKILSLSKIGDIVDELGIRFTEFVTKIGTSHDVLSNTGKYFPAYAHHKLAQPWICYPWPVMQTSNYLEMDLSQ